MKDSMESTIDDDQAETVEEHFERIMSDRTFISDDFVKVTRADLPSWYDEELFKRGQNYYLKNVLSFSVAYLVALISTFLIPTIAKILIFTKQSSTPRTAYTRYLQTTLHVCRLHEHDVKDPDSEFYKSLNTMRWRHATASKRSRNNNPSEGIFQRDMVISQFGLVGYVLLKPEYFGFTNAVDDREAFNHFWRVIGFLLGIPNRLNVCRKNENETTKLCRKIMEKVMVKNLENSAADFYFLTDNTVCGLKSLEPFLDTGAFYKIFYELHECTCKACLILERTTCISTTFTCIIDQKEVGMYSSVIYACKKSTLSSLRLPIVGRVLRVLWNRHVKVLLWLSEHYPILAWMKYGKNQFKLNLHPRPGV